MADEMTLLDNLKYNFKYSNNKSSTLSFIGSAGGHREGDKNGNYRVYYKPGEELTLLPEEILSILEIRAIRISFCTKLDLAGSFLMLPKLYFLASLHLRNCQIKQLAAEVKVLTSLILLDLSNERFSSCENELMTLPPEIGKLFRLQTLILDHNDNFESLPPEIAELTKLQKLSLRGFKSLPKNIELIPNLQSLDLVDSKLKADELIPLIDRPNGLQSIHMSSGGLGGVAKLTEAYPNLKITWPDSSVSLMRGEY